MTTQTKVAKKLLTLTGWWDYMESRYPRNGLMYFEQAALQSKHEKVCIDCCSDKDLVKRQCFIVASVPYYYMCGECHKYWENKK
jgi:hypothetical protein